MSATLVTETPIKFASSFREFPRMINREPNPEAGRSMISELAQKREALPPTVTVE